MIIIRADGNARIGAGHLMRCIAIAEELALLEGRREIWFLCADEQSGAMAEEHGFQSYVLGTDYQDMVSELPLWRKLTEKRVVRKEAEARKLVLLIDSYFVTDKYLEALGEIGYTVLMDDHGTHCYPVDCVINYNAPASLEAYQKLYREQYTKLLIGSKYVPLRRQFRVIKEENASERLMAAGKEITMKLSKDVAETSIVDGQSLTVPYEIKEEAKAVLITTGGGDSENIAGEILKKLYTEYLEFHLVMGQFHPHFQEMSELDKVYANIHIHHNVKDMAGLMGMCDIAVTAGGSTIYELAAVGVPFICFSYAENQEMLTEYVGKEHMAGYAGAWHKEPGETLERIERLFGELVTDKRMRISYSEREQRMVDGRGAERIAGLLRNRERNDELVR